ncbi:MAG: serine/threonine-protein kinase [Vicinamibacterales bacterium]
MSSDSRTTPRHDPIDPSWDWLACHYETLAALPAAAQADALVRAAGDRPDLVDELRAMLVGGRPDAALEIERQLMTPGGEDGLAPGSAIGPYTVVRLIGRGGMGEVYLAERDNSAYRQQVAVKVLRAGIYGEAAVARFERERRILARLTHPAVVPLLDGGVSTDGRPYLVLQYVDGRSVTRYADDERLSVRARLGRFIEVCRAVQYAHAQLIVHRDIKPSNILVSAQGAIRLLDFGIAKMLDDEPDEADVTRRGVGPMTPERAAPEQLRGDPPTTATDVWALGVLLYELLTGGLPFGSNDGNVVSRIEGGRFARPSRALSGDVARIAAARATTPRRLQRALRGDIERIIAKALHVDPARRYDGAADLADDVRACLDGRPVTAQPDSVVYRVHRFIGRNRAVTAAGVVAAAALLTVAVNATLQARRIAEERDRATAEQRRAAAVVDLMAQVLGQTDPRNGQGLTTVAVDDLLGRAESFVPTLAPDPDVQGRMLQALGSIRFVRGERPKGLAILQRGLAVTGGLPLTHPVRTGLLLDHADALTKSGQTEEARTLIEPLVAALRAEVAQPGTLAAALRALALAVRGDAGIALADEALRLDRPAAPVEREAVAADLDALGNVQFALARTALAEAAWREALRLLEAEHGADHPTTMLVLGNLASVLDDRAQAEERLSIFRRLIAFNERLYGAVSVQAATAWNNLGVTLVRMRRMADGEEALRRAAERYTQTAGPAHPQTIGALRNVARTLEFQDRFEPALELFAEIVRRQDVAAAPAVETRGGHHLRGAGPVAPGPVAGSLAAARAAAGGSARREARRPRRSATPSSCRAGWPWPTTRHRARPPASARRCRFARACTRPLTREWPRPGRNSGGRSSPPDRMTRAAASSRRR